MTLESGKFYAWPISNYAVGQLQNFFFQNRLYTMKHYECDDLFISLK